MYIHKCICIYTDIYTSMYIYTNSKPSAVAAATGWPQQFHIYIHTYLDTFTHKYTNMYAYI